VASEYNTNLHNPNRLNIFYQSAGLHNFFFFINDDEIQIGAFSPVHKKNWPIISKGSWYPWSSRSLIMILIWL